MIRNPNPRPDRGRSHHYSPLPATNEEIVRAFEEQRKRLPVVKTTRTPSGQILDWVPIEAQVPHGQIATPPSQNKAQVAEPNRGAATFEMNNPRIERGPAGTVPILRQDFSRLHVTDALRDYPRKRKVDGRRLNPRPDKPPTADPDPFGYYHATSSQMVTNYGCAAVLNLWDPYCEYEGDHSISQFGIQNYDKGPAQSLEAGWEVAYSQYGDFQTHLFTYYTTNGYAQDGDYLGGYNYTYAGWVQTDPNLYPGALLNNTSTYGGNQLELTIQYQLSNGNWWFQAQGTWLGYYPASLFTGNQSVSATLGNYAEWAGFWGEVYSQLSDPTQTTTQMGSGNFAEAGSTYAAYQRNTQIQTDPEGTMSDSDGSPSAENPAMYDIQSSMQSGTSSGSHFWFGGPGA